MVLHHRRDSAPVRLGVIADTHGLLRPEAVAALADADLILHAGDIGKPEVLEGLRALAPVVAVRGNVDRGDWANDLPEREVVTVAGHNLLLLHNIAELPAHPAANGCAAVVFGHSHQPRVDVVEGVLFFNPGSAGPRRFRLPVAVGRLDWDGTGWRGDIIHLPI